MDVFIFHADIFDFFLNIIWLKKNLELYCFFINIWVMYLSGYLYINCFFSLIGIYEVNTSEGRHFNIFCWGRAKTTGPIGSWIFHRPISWPDRLQILSEVAHISSLDLLKKSSSKLSPIGFVWWWEWKCIYSTEQKQWNRFDFCFKKNNSVILNSYIIYFFFLNSLCSF